MAAVEVSAMAPSYAAGVPSATAGPSAGTTAVPTTTTAGLSTTAVTATAIQQEDPPTHDDSQVCPLSPLFTHALICSYRLASVNTLLWPVVQRSAATTPVLQYISTKFGNILFSCLPVATVCPTRRGHSGGPQLPRGNSCFCPPCPL
jgi:hypothetical protein